MNNIIPIAMVTDDNYVMPTLVCLKSMFENKNKESVYKIYIFTDSVSEESKEKLQNMNDINFEINILPINNEYANYDNGSIYVTNATFIRFDIPDVLKEYDKILYLDVDMIVLQDLSELFNTELNDTYVGAILDVGEILYKLTNRVKTKFYFNAGLLLINAKKYRQDNMKTKLVEAYNEHKKEFTLNDQDTLNYCFNNNVTLLHPKYNYQQSISDYRKSDVEKYYGLKYKDLSLENITIIHYTRMKPWIYKCTYLKSVWDKYCKLCNIKKTAKKSGIILRTYLIIRGLFKLNELNNLIVKILRGNGAKDI